MGELSTTTGGLRVPASCDYSIRVNCDFGGRCCIPSQPAAMLRPIRRMVHRSTSGRRVDPKPIGVDFVAQLSRLAEPIAVGNACGSALDDTQALAALEAYRVFGRIKAPGDEPDWRAIPPPDPAALPPSTHFH